VHALEGARETLQLLAGAGVRTALICDTGLTPGRVVRRHLDALGLLPHLEAQVFSDEVGVPKPDPRVFHRALELLDAEPARAVHVGDLLRTDVAGARAVGMRSVRLRGHHDDEDAAGGLGEADYVADSHAQLRAILGRADGGALPLPD
jgi:putative hydrolase of the HAD superfamily